MLINYGHDHQGFGGPENPMQFHGVAEKYLYVDDPYIKSKALFAIDEKNKELDIVGLILLLRNF